MSYYTISGDCGGTNTRLSLWATTTHQAQAALLSGQNMQMGQPLFAQKYQNEHYSSFVQVLQLFLKEAQAPKVPTVCVLACAGPILNNTVTFTNVETGWMISGDALATELGIPTVRLINDFAAMGYGLLTLQKHEVHELHGATRDPHGPIATIGAGTGLGECFLTPNANSTTYQCFACEGGHADFAPADDLEVELLNFLKTKFNEKSRVSVERVISGIGLSNIYEFLAQKFPKKVDSAVHQEWKEAGAMQGAVISRHATKNALCGQAMDIFVAAYGREAGNAALKYFPRGGFYITGGLAPKNIEHLTRNNAFINAYFDKGRVSAALKDIPLYVVTSEDIGERGAYLFAIQLLAEQVLGLQKPGAKPKCTVGGLCPYTSLGMSKTAFHVTVASLGVLAYYFLKRK